jgi:hypothetical protein
MLEWNFVPRGVGFMLFYILQHLKRLTLPYRIATAKVIRGQNSQIPSPKYLFLLLLHKHYPEQVSMMQKKDPNTGSIASDLASSFHGTAVHTYIARWICNQSSAHNIQKKIQRYFQASLIVPAMINRLCPIPAGVQRPVVVKLKTWQKTNACQWSSLEPSPVMAQIWCIYSHENLCNKNWTIGVSLQVE